MEGGGEYYLYVGGILLFTKDLYADEIQTLAQLQKSCPNLFE